MLRFLLIFIALSFPFTQVIADWKPDQIRVGYGQFISPFVSRSADIQQYRAGLIWDISENLWESDNLKLKSYAELGLGYWKSTLNPEPALGHLGAKSARQISLSPVLRLVPSQTGSSLTPFLDIGAGLSYQTEEDLEQQDRSGINMGGRWQFELRLMIGLEFGEKQQFEVSYGWMHYSNAHLEHINEGMDFLTLQVGYHF